MLTTFEYDQVGNTTKVIDPEGFTLSHYDARNRLKDTTTPDPDGSGTGNPKTGGTTSYLYDADGDVTKMTDPAENVTDYHYNNLDRLDSETARGVYLDSGHTSVDVTRTYGYDANGNLTDETDRLGRRRKFVFDANNHLIEERWLIGATGTAASNALHFRYDTGGRQIWADSAYTAGGGDNLHDYQFTYDALSRVTHSQQSLGTSNPNAVTLDQIPDADSNVSTQSAHIAGTADYANSYSYDNLDHLTGVYQSLGDGSVRWKKVIFGVNQVGQTRSIDRYTNATSARTGAAVAGAHRSYGYDNAGYLTSMTYASGSPEYAIGRDAKHRVTSLRKDGGTAQSFGYFFDDQLKSAPGQTFDYDQNFNRTSNSGHVGGDNRLKDDGNYTYEYDKEGNLQRRTEKALTQGGHNYVEFTYDDRNRLTGAVFYGLGGATQVKSISYAYDAADRLIYRFAGSNAVSPGETRYAYDGSDVIFTFAGPSVSPSAMTGRFLLGPNEHQVLAQDTPGNNTAAGTPTRWYEPDYLGSTRKIADDRGTLTSSLDFDAWGQMTSHTGPLPLVGFTGGLYDPDIDYTLMGIRWERDGRFLTQDPLGVGTNPDVYVNNDPMNYTDPTGMYASVVGLGSSAGARSSDAATLAGMTQFDFDKTYYRGDFFGKNQRVQGFGDWTEPPPPLTGLRDPIPADAITSSRISNPYMATLWDLEQRKNNDYTQNGGRPGPDSPYLWEQIQAVKYAFKNSDDTGPAIGYAIADWPSAYWETAKNGQQNDAMNGYFQGYNKQLGTDRYFGDISPYYGHVEDFDNGQMVARGAMKVMAAAAVIYGAWGTAAGVADLLGLGSIFGGGGAATTAGTVVTGGGSLAAVQTTGVGLLETLLGIKMMSSSGSGYNAQSNPPQNPHLAGKTPQAGSRGTGVDRATKQEVELVRKTGKGTADWTPGEIEFIKTTGRLPDNTIGHHINNVADFPEWAGDPRNIRFVRGQKGNLTEHGGNFQNSTTGPLIDREELIRRAGGSK